MGDVVDINAQRKQSFTLAYLSESPGDGEPRPDDLVGAIESEGIVVMLGAGDGRSGFGLTPTQAEALAIALLQAAATVRAGL